jgi:hypothetical protein
MAVTLPPRAGWRDQLNFWHFGFQHFDVWHFDFLHFGFHHFDVRHFGFHHFDVRHFDFHHFDILMFNILMFDTLAFDILAFEILDFDNPTLRPWRGRWDKNQTIKIMISFDFSRAPFSPFLTGWPDWANFRPLDNSLLWAAFWEITKSI